MISDPKDSCNIVDKDGKVLSPIFTVMLHCSICKTDHGAIFIQSKNLTSKFLKAQNPSLCQSCFKYVEDALMRQNKPYRDTKGKLHYGSS